METEGVLGGEPRLDGTRISVLQIADRVLDLDLVGTPSILADLFEAAAIDERKLRRALDELREIGWFSAGLLDKIELETGIS